MRTQIQSIVSSLDGSSLIMNPILGLRNAQGERRQSKTVDDIQLHRTS